MVKKVFAIFTSGVVNAPKYIMVIVKKIGIASFVKSEN